LRPVDELSVEEIDAGIRLGKLRAVKMHKERTKLFLMDSKKIVEQYFKDHGLQFPPMSC
jgi:ribosomal protein L7/L12